MSALTLVFTDKSLIETIELIDVRPLFCVFGITPMTKREFSTFCEKRAKKCFEQLSKKDMKDVEVYFKLLKDFLDLYRSKITNSDSSLSFLTNFEERYDYIETTYMKCFNMVVLLKQKNVCFDDFLFVGVFSSVYLYSRELPFRSKTIKMPVYKNKDIFKPENKPLFYYKYAYLVDDIFTEDSCCLSDED